MRYNKFNKNEKEILKIFNKSKMPENTVFSLSFRRNQKYISKNSTKF
jgi:hypothetical protein